MIYTRIDFICLPTRSTICVQDPDLVLVHFLSTVASPALNRMIEFFELFPRLTTSYVLYGVEFWRCCQLLLERRAMYCLSWQIHGCENSEVRISMELGGV